ncbi:Rpn family recombination-promoting nuclease/putative transposase [Calothrix sp. FACHB-1219]|uniref:Rpn family recombination-promoting nuclease/putative transposase n=1 Tax=unclassified Calothrix TaxID=2619626 RepID=UPI001689A071|nr:Rpn family recombination-promoting nuclease/putative transposase [Calothrix sp. FACHB-168]MBD2202221.1 Rpn family recombination-promoting nuclease/putative transposase [Calothrix sp. FACHB-168]MBD2217628.1 Rpn family recombination-promoting nuclease/putative transposase [Calothrix sp. FACHB-1219]
MKTDSIFYRLFQELPEIFFELIGNPPENAEAYQFSSVEIKQTAFRIDGVFLPIQGEQNPIYFVEVQFQPDAEIYSRLVSEIYLYLRQNQPKNYWRGVVIYPTRSLDISDIHNYSELFTSQRISRIYLDELGEIASLPVGIATIKLVLEDKDTAIVSARELINRTQQEINTGSKQRQLLELIETILVYKFPTMSREDIESMFGLSELKQTKVYQEAKQEGIEEGRQRGIAEANLNAISGMLMLGLTIEQIAQALNLDIEQVRNAAQQAKTQNDR